VPEIRTVTTLKRRRHETSASIGMYEKKIAQARPDMAHVAAAVRIFEAPRGVSLSVNDANIELKLERAASQINWGLRLNLDRYPVHLYQNVSTVLESIARPSKFKVRSAQAGSISVFSLIERGGPGASGK